MPIVSGFKFKIRAAGTTPRTDRNLANLFKKTDNRLDIITQNSEVWNKN